MDHRQLLLQRCRDGEADRASAATAEHLLAGDDALRAQERALEQVDDALGSYYLLQWPAGREALVARIAAALPAELPEARRGIRIDQVLVATCLASATALIYGAAGTVRDLLNLTLLAAISIAMGAVLVLSAGTLARAEQGLLGRVLRRRVPVEPAAALPYRTVGTIMLLWGVIWAIQEL